MRVDHEKRVDMASVSCLKFIENPILVCREMIKDKNIDSEIDAPV